MEQNYQKLEQRIAALEKWQKEKTAKQISFPLDPQSVGILNQYFMRITGTIITIGGAGGNEFTTYIGNQAGLNFELSKNQFIPYTVDVTSNVFTVTSVYFQDDMQVYPVSSDTVPAPLVSGNNYFIINSTGLTFKLSATQGGAAIDITDDGTGQQFLLFF